MNTAIIVGAGKGKRMNEKMNKILLTLIDKPIICHTIERFENSELINNIILVINKDDESEIKKIIEKNNYKKIIKIVNGGEQRQDSVYNGIKAVDAQDDDIILIHNAANPFVTEKTIREVINAASQHGAAVAAIRARDTIKEVDRENFVIRTLDREKLWQMQTPQAIKFSIAKKAFEKAYKEGFYGTDDASLVERLGSKVKIVETDLENIKITAKPDLEIARTIKSNARIGFGQDSHRFAKEKKELFLGGVLIEGENGLEGNSDGDVVLHAIFNALSQAVGEKSISHYADSMCRKGIKDSKEYLKVAKKLVEEKNCRINNIGVMVEAKKPKLEPYAERMKEAIANILEIKKEDVGITFTSGEELTDFGRGLGIQAFAVCSVVKE
jgi:2-C-methyl-D-erythritol 4-phosphate cytidylyltransferase/2-C-methyl-D-erythritol 2,4-cyclodiphosphate synthase